MDNLRKIYPVVKYQTRSYHLGDGVCVSFDTATGIVHVSGVYDCNTCATDDLSIDIRELIEIVSQYTPELLPN